MDAGAYAIENTTGRGIVADDNYWGATPAEWAIGATGVITGLITFNTVRTAADAPVLTHIAPGTGVAGNTITIHGANFGEMARVCLPLIVRYD